MNHQPEISIGIFYGIGALLLVISGYLSAPAGLLLLTPPYDQELSNSTGYQTMGLISSRRKADGGYTPPIIHELLKPITSGNTINVNCVLRDALPMLFIATNGW